MGILLCEQNFRGVWIRNKSVRAEIGHILRAHTHTRAAKLVVEMRVMYKQTRTRDNETECDGTWTRKGLLHVVATWSATFAELCAL